MVAGFYGSNTPLGWISVEGYKWMKSWKYCGISFPLQRKRV